MSGNQILAYAKFSWPAALELAGMRPRRQVRPAGNRRPLMNPVPGMPVVQVVAVYAALNAVWPSYPVLLHFAATCNIRMQNAPPGGMGPRRIEAAGLLRGLSLAPPSRTSGGGKGRRLTYRYPANGIPGAPLRDAAPCPRPVADARLDVLARELTVASLRVWLAGLGAGDKRVRSEYVRWQVGSGWPSASSFDRRDFGGFASLKREASEQNRSVRQAGGDPSAEALTCAGVVRAEVKTLRAGGEADQPEPVPFEQALRTVLAGPYLRAEPPKQ
jgi:hypothetical protein